MIRIIAGKFKGRSLEVPKVGTRPTQGMLREALFNICQQTIEGANFLDLFAGGGAIGLEALSRGAKSVTFIEKNSHILKKNCASLGVEEQVICYNMDVFKALPLLETAFDIIFADPPYEKGMGEKLLHYFDSRRELVLGDLFIEEGQELPLPHHLQLKSKRKRGRSILYHYSNNI